MSRPRPFWNWEALLPFYISPPACSEEGASSLTQQNHEEYSKTPKTSENMSTQPGSSTGPVPATSPPSDKKKYEIDGETFSTLEEFYETISNVLIPGADWGHNLDAFNDILRGGFGTPSEGFTLVWRNSDVSKQRLGFEETARQLRKRMNKCHPSDREIVAQELREAERGKGSTVFEWLVQIILVHSQGGEEGEDGVVLVLN